MPTRSLQFDGPDLEVVLEQALAEAGPGGKVVAADRVRRGGIAGFFAREHFEVTVEIDDAGRREGRAELPPAVASPAQSAAAAATKPAATDAPPSWARLADDTEDVVELSHQRSPAVPRATATSAGTTAARGTSTVGASVETAIAGRTTGSTATGAASTGRSSFASVLAGIARSTVLEAGSNVVAAPERETVTSPRPHGAETVTSPRPHGAETVTSPRPHGAEAFAEVASSTASAEPPDAALGGDTQGTRVTSGRPPVAPAAGDGQSGPVGRALAAVGMPEALLPRPAVLGCLDTLVATDDAEASLHLVLTRALTRLPKAPPLPDGAGRLLVVTGELERARALAGRLAVEVGLDPAQVLVAADRRPRRRVDPRLLLRCVEDAAELTARRRRSRTPTVMAMDAPVSAAPDPWAPRLLDTLMPTAVWGVASATQKVEDVAAWAEAIGGLAALALTDMAATASPAQILGLGIPVASLDGRQATPALWAALLIGRLVLGQARGAGADDLVPRR